MDALHRYGEWCRHSENGMVGIIVDEKPYKSEFTKDTLGLRTTYVISWHNGKRQNARYFEADLITEYEYFKVVDPSRCNNDFPVNEPRECYFTGTIRRFRTMPKDNEDLF